MTDEQTAAAIVADPMNAASETALEAAIVRALQAAYANGFTNGHTVGINHEANREVLRMCHEARMCNGIVDYSDPNAVGVVRRVLGHLAITKDGWVIGDDCRVWQDGQMWATELFRVPIEGSGRWAPYRTYKVYSSEAAEAAKEEKK